MTKKIQLKISTKCSHIRKSNSFLEKSNNNTNIWITKNKIRRLNPSIFHFNKESHFIYEPRYNSFFLDKLKDKNKIKPNNEMIDKLINKILFIIDIHNNKFYPKNIQIR